MVDTSFSQTSMDEPTMKEIPKIMEPPSEFSIVVDQSQDFGSLTEIEFPEKPIPSEASKKKLTPQKL